MGCSIEEPLHVKIDGISKMTKNSRDVCRVERIKDVSSKGA